jgi:hypothetical protein
MRTLLEEVAAGDVLADVIEKGHEQAPLGEGSYLVFRLKPLRSQFVTSKVATN